MKKWIVIIAVVIAAGGIGRLWQSRSRDDEPRRPGRGRVAVVTEPVSRATVYDTGRLSGSLQPRSSVIVAPRVGGRLERLPLDIGDPVRHGDTVAVIDREEYEQQRRQAEAEVDVARANEADARSALEIARRDLHRVTELREQAIASESELDAAQSRFDAAEARVQVAHAQVRQRDAGLEGARIRLSYTRILASWKNGDEPRVIGERFVHEGTILRPNDPIVSILDIAHLTAVVHAVERDYPKVHVGQRAVVTADAWPGETFDGTVARVAPLVREASRQARVEIDVPNPHRKLRPGMFVRAAVEFDRHEDACSVPVAALVRRDGREGVFQPDPDTGTAHFVPVTVGIRDRDRVHIVEPVLSGAVITLGQHLLDDGTEISMASSALRGEGSDCAADAEDRP